MDGQDYHCIFGQVGQEINVRKPILEVVHHLPKDGLDHDRPVKGVIHIMTSAELQTVVVVSMNGIVQPTRERERASEREENLM